jgi:hypothetical protein
LLFHACIPASEFGCPWPQGVPLQVHAMEADELFVAGAISTRSGLLSVDGSGLPDHR